MENCSGQQPVNFGPVATKKEGASLGMAGITGDQEVIGQGNVNDISNPLSANFNPDVMDLGPAGDIPGVEYQGISSDDAVDDSQLNNKPLGTYYDVSNDPREDPGTFADVAADHIRRGLFNAGPEDDVGGFGEKITADPNAMERRTSDDVVSPLGDREKSENSQGLQQGEVGFFGSQTSEPINAFWTKMKGNDDPMLGGGDVESPRGNVDIESLEGWGTQESQ